MSTEDLKSTTITARDLALLGAPYTTPSIRLSGAEVKESVATFEFTATTGVSTYRICEIPVSARISQIFMRCDGAIDSAGAIDIGLYQTTQNGGAVVDQDCYASAVVLTTGITTVELNLRYESASTDIANIEYPVWQDAGLTEATQPIRGWRYDIVATTTTPINTTGGTVTFNVRYVDGE